MKEQALSPGSRAALQGLIALASAVGIGALLTRFFLERTDSRDRQVGAIVFEGFSIVAILTAAAVTACSSVLLLHEDEVLSNAELARASVPLVISLVLLVLLAAGARFSTLAGGFWPHLPTFSATLLLGLVVGSALAFVALQPTGVLFLSLAILGVGACLSWSFLRLERFSMRGSQTGLRKHLARLCAAGYEPTERTLHLAVPTSLASDGELSVICWIRKDRLFLDEAQCDRLRKELRALWVDVETGNALPASGEIILSSVDLGLSPLPWPPRFHLTVETYKRGEPERLHRRVPANDLGLFDLTDAGVFR